MTIIYIERVNFRKVNGVVYKGQHDYVRKTKDETTLNNLMKKLNVVYAKNIKTNEVLFDRR